MAISTPSTDEFRLAFPAFTLESYNDAFIEYWMKQAEKQVSKCRWGDMYAHGVYLLTAHALVLQMRAINAGGSTPGDAQAGALTSTSKHVGPVSKSSGYTLSVNVADGDLNSTVYGQEFARLRRMYGMGPMQITPTWLPNRSGICW